MTQSNSARATSVSLDLEDRVGALIDRARKAGAHAADASVFGSDQISVGRRLGKIETLERADSAGVDLRVFVDGRVAQVSGSDLSDHGLARLAERAVSMARFSPQDPFAQLAEQGQLATDWPALETADPVEPSTDVLLGMAEAMEDAMLAVEGVTNSGGVSAGWTKSSLVMATTNGFLGSVQATRTGISGSAIAGSGEAQKRDFDYDVAVFGEDLGDPAAVGREAGTRAVRQLGARPGATAKVPVIFEPRVAVRMLGLLTGAINGESVVRGTSLLADHIGEIVISPELSVHEDPFRARGQGSRPFDGEGLPVRPRAIFENGVLQTHLHNLATAAQAGVEPTGHASRAGASIGVGHANVWLSPGSVSVEDMFATAGEAFYVTSLMGQGANMITGDYSQGATGFWVRNGQLAEPVESMTLGGRLQDMWRSMSAADDLTFFGGMGTPTVQMDGLTVAGA
ncbi:MAG: modulator protein [Kiloniella sp.]|nr:modulator protein [Kiloniella sp.]